MKESADIEYIKRCKKGQITPTFAKVNAYIAGKCQFETQTENCYFNYGNRNAK